MKILSKTKISLAIGLLFLSSIILFRPNTSEAQNPSFCNSGTDYKFLCCQLNGSPSTGCPTTLSSYFGKKSWEGRTSWLVYPDPFTGEQIWALRNLLLGGCKDFSPENIDKAMKIICESNAGKTDATLKKLCNYCTTSNEADKNLLELLSSSDATIRGGGVNFLVGSYEGGKEADFECMIGLPRLNFWSILSSPFNWLIGAILTAITAILKLILWVIIGAFDWFLNPINFGGYVNFVVETQLWQFSRDLANLVLILATIFMALATILKLKEYSWDKLLWRIVVIALLVNFSLVICGILVDLSNFLTTYFLTQGGGYSLWEIISETITKLACAFSASKADWNFTIGSAVGLILTGAFIFQFIGLLLFVVTRVVTLWLTLILSPLGFAAFVIPVKGKNGNPLWDTWRNYFTQAIISLPAIAFTLYFILIILNQLTNTLQSQLNEANFITLAAYAVLVVVFVQAVQVVAKALGIKQIESGYKVAQKAIVGAGVAVAGFGALRTIQTIKESKPYQQVGQTLASSRIPGLQGVGLKMITEGPAEAQKRVKKYEGEFEGVSKEDFKRMASVKGPSKLDRAGYERFIGGIHYAAEKGWGFTDSQTQFIEDNIDDRKFNSKLIATAAPHKFTIDPETKKLTVVKPSIEAGVSNLATMKSIDIKNYTDGAGFIEHYSKQAQIETEKKKYDEYRQAGLSEEEAKEKAKKAGAEAAEETIKIILTEILNNLSPAQVAAFMQSIGEKDLKAKGWGGGDGLFMRILKKMPEMEKKFNEMRRASYPLREIFGAPPSKREEEENDESEETLA